MDKNYQTFVNMILLKIKIQGTISNVLRSILPWKITKSYNFTYHYLILSLIVMSLEHLMSHANLSIKLILSKIKFDHYVVPRIEKTRAKS